MVILHTGLLQNPIGKSYFLFTRISDKPPPLAIIAILVIQVSAVYDYNGWLTEEERGKQTAKEKETLPKTMDNAEYIECEKDGEKSRARGKNQVQINGTVAVHPAIHPSIHLPHRNSLSSSSWAWKNVHHCFQLAIVDW